MLRHHLRDQLDFTWQTWPGCLAAPALSPAWHHEESAVMGVRVGSTRLLSFVLPQSKSVERIRSRCDALELLPFRTVICRQYLLGVQVKGFHIQEAKSPNRPGGGGLSCRDVSTSGQGCAWNPDHKPMIPKKYYTVGSKSAFP